MEDPGSDGLDPAAAGSKKNARRQQARIFFQDESGVSQRPSIRRTWAPKGETPVLIHAFNRSKLSLCAAIGCRWDGPRRQLQHRQPDCLPAVKYNFGDRLHNLETPGGDR